MKPFPDLHQKALDLAVKVYGPGTKIVGRNQCKMVYNSYDVYTGISAFKYHELIYLLEQKLAEKVKTSVTYDKRVINGQEVFVKVCPPVKTPDRKNKIRVSKNK